MVMLMKNRLSKTLVLILLFCSGYVSAALYRGLDAEGNVVYSDTPFESAEKFTPPPISVVDGPEAKAAGDDRADDKAGKPAEFKYLQFDIVSPANKQTIRDEIYLTVTLNLRPGLNTEAGHTIWLLLDDRPVIKNSQDLSLRLEQVDRGAHKLQAQVRDPAGKIVVRSRAIVVFIHRTIAP